MSRSRRKVKERDPKIVKLAISLVSPIWVAALLFFVSNGSVSFFPPGLSKRVDPTPLVIAFLLTVGLLAIVFAVLKIQNAAGKSLAQLQAMTPDVFEDWVAARFRNLGYSVKTAGAQGDHGVDLVAEKPGELAVIQCKNYKSWSVGEPILRDLFGAMHDFGADRAYLVTTGRLTQPAIKWAEGKPIEIWDGERVARLSKEMASQTSRPMTAMSDRPQSPDSQPPALVVATTSTSAAPDNPPPACPRCGSTLVERRNRTTGESFLACPGFPACRYTQPVPACVG